MYEIQIATSKFMNFSVNGAFITFAYAEEVRIHQF